MQARCNERMKGKNQSMEHSIIPGKSVWPRSVAFKVRSLHCATTYGNTHIKIEAEYFETFRAVFIE